MARIKSLIETLILLSFSILSNGKIIQDSPAEEVYSDTPCEIRPLSAFRDGQGNLWGVGEGNLWWFNATNLSWSLLPLPNGSWATTDPWRVTCSDPKKYVALQSPQSTLILHLPWQHWQQVDMDSMTSSDKPGIDAQAFWCHSGTLYATDSLRKDLYTLDQEEARWVLCSSTGVDEIFNQSTQNDIIIAKSWPSMNGSLYLVESSKSCSHILLSNINSSEWTIVKKREKNEPWPTLEEQVITWGTENGNLWLWKEAEIWVFNASSLQWKKMNPLHLTLSKLESILTTWSRDDNTLCFLTRTEKCIGQYSSSSTNCWTDFALEPDIDASTSFSPPSSRDDISVSPSTARIIAAPPQTSTPSTTSGTMSESPIFVSIHNVVNKHSLLAALPSELEESQDEVIENDMPVTVVSYSSSSDPWHKHTSVFGSVIFFGTSLTIFGVVGSFWCMRRCVHFPKEALLLRDPPSVRYTAIPDSVSYDARGQPTAATYAVIPDSIA